MIRGVLGRLLLWATLGAPVGASMVASVDAAAQAGEGTIRFALATLPPHQANPFSTSAQPTITTTSAIFDGLTRHARDGALKPWLATSWENRDPKTWRFHLRRGVTFSNGRPFNAGAVAAAVDYLATKARPIDTLARDLPAFAAARVIDDSTVDIVTAAPMPTLPRYVALLLIPEPETFARLGVEGFAKAPVGTGPFRLERWEPARVVLAAFERSWRKPRAAGLELIELPDPTARLQALLSGRADIAIGLGPEDMQTLAAAGLTGVSWTDGGVVGISLVATRDLPFKDARVRRALNMAVNRQPIVDVIMQGRTVPANQPAARGVYGYDPTIAPYDYDPARAKALLAEAGYGDGFSFTMETSAATGAALAAYQQVAADLARVGVTMTIRPLTGPQYLRNVFLTGEFGDAIVVPWMPTPPLDVIRAIGIHSCAAKAPWYCDPAATPLIDRALAEWNPDTALALRQQLGRRYHDEAAALFLYEQVFFAGTAPGVTGYEDAFGLVSYDTIAVAGK